jgi:hypothetical protein
MTTTVAAIADLLRTVPCVEAPRGIRAAWFDRKAEVFGRIAEAGGLEEVEAQRMAMHARALASLIRQGRA